MERFVSDVLDHPDAEGRLSTFYEGYREDGWGHPAYHPVLLVTVLVYVGPAGNRQAPRTL